MNLFLATEVRSGSTYICELIIELWKQSFNVDFSDLYTPAFRDCEDSNNDQLIDIFENIKENNVGWKSSKIYTPELFHLLKRSSNCDELKEHLFGDKSYWIICTRTNVFAQAVSIAYAKKKSEWHVYDKDHKSKDIPITNQEILEAYKSVLNCNQFIESASYLIKNSLIVNYESMRFSEELMLNNITNFVPFKRDEDAAYIYPKNLNLKITDKDNKKKSLEEFKKYFALNIGTGIKSLL